MPVATIFCHLHLLHWLHSHWNDCWNGLSTSFLLCVLDKLFLLSHIEAIFCSFYLLHWPHARSNYPLMDWVPLFRFLLCIIWTLFLLKMDWIALSSSTFLVISIALTSFALAFDSNAFSIPFSVCVFHNMNPLFSPYFV